ncbi:MAG: hypothetical protein K6B40_03310 [Firmicutes bacterium]|nr:hypothetical protein [Bacillota bacterium]
MKPFLKPAWKPILLVSFTALILYMIIHIPIHSRAIDQQIAANVYADGVETAKTCIVMKGEITKRSFSDTWYYRGTFCIECCPSTCGEGVAAQISQEKGAGLGRIGYYHHGDFTTLALTGRILVDEDMSNIAVELEDGTIVATSEEAYSAYKSKR